MTPWSRRAVLAAAGALPALCAAGAARAAAGAVDVTDAGPPIASPPTRPDLLIDPSQELGGLDSVAADAVGAPGRSVLPASMRASAFSRLSAAGDTTSTAVPFTFRTTAFTIRALPTSSRPYAQTRPEPLVDTGTHDATGVRMFLWKGVLENHPVAQSQYGIHLLESYRLTGTRAYLDRAALQARRLVDRAVTRSDAWFYPYDFALNVHGTTDLFRPPWFSMMAQGQALSLFVRLFEVTRDAQWRAAADATFASYLLPFQAARVPWGVYVKDQLLRLEEYPSPTAEWGDQTYNGHVFSLFGLYDYHQLTGDARALSLLRGGLTTARDLLPLQRVANWRSRYCLRHGADAGRYHRIHIDQQRLMQAMTADEVFARSADALYRDFPPVQLGVDGTWSPPFVAFAAGTHPAYRFDAAGAVTARRTLTLGRASRAHASDRVRIKNRTGLWYAVSDGALKGWYVQERPGTRTMLGTQAVLAYPVARLAHVTVAHPAAITVSSTGVVSSRTTSYARGTPLWIDARGVLNGVEHLRVAAGTYRGRWIRVSALVL